MTKEEAIKELEEDKALYMPEEWIESIDRDTPDGRLITALDMAISALKDIEKIQIIVDAYFTRGSKSGYECMVEIDRFLEPYKAESEGKE